MNREKGDFKQRKKEIVEREKSEAVRYRSYYGIDVQDTSIYDIIVDTSDKTPEEIVQIILSRMKK